MGEKQQPMMSSQVIDLIDDNDTSTIVLDDDDDFYRNRPKVLKFMPSTINIDDSIISLTTIASPRTFPIENSDDDDDDCVITIDDDDEDIVELDDTNLLDKTSTSVDYQVDENSEENVDRIKCKRKNSQKDLRSSKKQKLGNVLSNSNTNLVTGDLSVRLDCVDRRSRVVSFENGKVKKPLKNSRAEREQLCEALKNAALNNSNTFAYCFQSFITAAGEGVSSKEEADRGRNEDGGGDKKENDEMERGGDEGDKKNDGDGKKKAKEGNDMILVASTEAASSSGSSSVATASSSPVATASSSSLVATASSSSSSPSFISLSSDTVNMATWSKPAHLDAKRVSSLWDGVKNAGFKAQHLQSVSSNIRPLMSNFVKVSPKNKKSNKMSKAVKMTPKNKKSNKLSKVVKKSSKKNNAVNKRSNKEKLMAPVKPMPQGSESGVIVIDDSTKVFKPRDQPGDISVVGNNVFIPSSMPEKTGPRPVFIDGCNVAFSHGRNTVFSVKGIEICVQYFKRLGNKPFVVLPNHRKGYLSDEILRVWQSDGTLVVTPSRRINHSLVAADDDRYVIQCAAAMDGVIVTSDQYRDHMGINPVWDETIKNRLLMLTWIQDMLIFPDDPLGRHGPKLRDFLMY